MDTGDETLDADFFNAERQFINDRRQIRKGTKSIYDRLRSIQLDSEFVESVIDKFKLPAVCNERCGRWYVPPSRLSASAYFKSTDGHTDHCKFSLRRLNIHLIPLISGNGGAIIVDSTRNGKRMPDALSKTVPIWCTVMNRLASAFFDRSWSRQQLDLYTPGKVVSQSEHSKIQGQLDQFTEALENSGLDRSTLSGLTKPLRPLWITPSSDISCMNHDFSDSDFYPIILVTASRCIPDGGVERANGFTYIQGSADDEEMWSRGLTSSMFDSHGSTIFESSSESLEETIDRIVAEVNGSARKNNRVVDEVDRITRIGQTNVYLVPCITLQDLDRFRIIDLSIKPQLDLFLGEDEALERFSGRYLHTPLRDGKKGSPQLSSIFSRIERFIQSVPLVALGTSSSIASRHEAMIDTSRAVLVTDDEDCKSKAPTVALLLGCLAHLELAGRIDKENIRKQLVTIVNSRVGVNPNRAYLKMVNEYLMSGGYKP